MAQTSNTKVSTTPSSTTAKKQPTAAEMREWYEKNKKHIEKYAAAEQAAVPLRDITKTTTKTITAFSRDSLRTYLQNIGSNEKNLRNLSRYLYYRCHPYYRLINYNANMFCLNARSVIPQFDFVKGNDATKMLKSYQDTLYILDRLNIQYEMLKAYVT